MNEVVARRLSQAMAWLVRDLARERCHPQRVFNRLQYEVGVDRFFDLLIGEGILEWVKEPLARLTAVGEVEAGLWAHAGCCTHPVSIHTLPTDPDQATIGVS